MTDQSISLDLAQFSKDLQVYYSKIHEEISQLKEIITVPPKNSRQQSNMAQTLAIFSQQSKDQ
jgi:hypothetical protein